MLTFGVISAACSGSGKPNAQAKRAAQAKAKAKANQAAKAKRVRAAVRRRQIVARRRAAQRAAALRRAQAQPPATTAPSVTVPQVTVPHIATATPATDLAAIERAFTRLNDGFQKGVAAGIVASVYSNYWVATRHYTPAECTKFEASRGGGVVSEAFAVQPQTLKPDPGWVDPTVGKTPTGRIYAISVTDRQTLVTTGETREQDAVMHATVNPTGTAFLFFRCA